MLDHLVTEADLARLRSAREASEGERGRLRCRRCRRGIPDAMRADAVYCSVQCKRAFRWEQRDELVREIRAAVRSEKVIAACPGCGAPLDTTFRPGPPPRSCIRCYNREYARRRRAGIQAGPA